jgi:hypothetical protein
MSATNTPQVTVALGHQKRKLLLPNGCRLDVDFVANLGCDTKRISSLLAEAVAWLSSKKKLEPSLGRTSPPVRAE